MWSHQSNSSGSTLAACQSTSGLPDVLDGLKVHPRCCSCLPQRPLHIWSTELALCIQSNFTCSACGLRWGSEVSPSTDRPSGTVCRLYYEHQGCHRTLSHRHTYSWNSVSSVLRAPGLSVTERFHTVTRTLKTQLFSTARHRWDVSTRFRRRIQMTYLVTYLLNNVITTCINFSYLTLFTRKLCERRWSLVVMCEDNDTCIGHRCVNNAQCKRIIGGYNCGPCPTGFAGLYCQRGDSSFSSQLSQCYSF